jgi:hypothetical protein
MTRARRLLIQLALLPVLYIVSLPNPTTFTIVVAVALFIPPAITGAVAGVLIWSSRQAPTLLTLRDRADDAVTSFLQSMGAAAVGTVALLTNFGIILPGKPVLALLTWICILIAVPAIGWMGTWRDVWRPLVWPKKG